MRFRTIIYIFVLVAMLGWLWRLHRSESQRLKPPPERTDTIHKPAFIAPTLGAKSDSERVGLANRTSFLRGVTSPESGVKGLIDSLNVPIDFYGRVIDQNSNGLPDVKIVALVQHQFVIGLRTFQLAATNLLVERITGPDGRFEVSGVAGSGFDLESIRKEGYEAEPTRRGFGPQEGRFEDPIVFKMWPTNLHEPLISGTKPFHIVPDGRAYVIDLEQGVIKESGPGDLRIWVRRPNSIVYGERYDWSCEIDGIDGASLLKEPDLGASMYEAPDGGYMGSSKFEEPATVNGWGDSTGIQRFYVKLKSGQEYGRISVEVYAYYNAQIPGLVRLSYVINPSGSRILR